MQQLDPRDIHKRFGVLHGSIEYFLPDDSGTIRRLTFAASNATGVIVGILTLALLSAITVEIGIIVRSDLQGRGIGRALLAYALEWAGTNRMSRALALAAGFRVVEQDEFCSKMIASIFSREHSGRTSGVVYLS